MTSIKTKQRPGVGAADLDSILFADLDRVEPGGTVRMILKWIVDGKQDAVGPDRQHGVDQRLRAEITARGDVKVFAEIVAHRSLGRPARQLGQPVIEPPKIVWNALAKMAQNDL